MVEAAEWLERVAPSQGRRDASAVASSAVRVGRYAPDRDRQTLTRLAERLRGEICPLVALEPLDREPWAGRPLHEPDSVIGDITGVSHLFGGEFGLLRATETLLDEIGSVYRLAIADTVGAAWAWAHYGGGIDGRGLSAGSDAGSDARVIPIGGLPGWLDPLPIEALRIDVATAGTLGRLGVATIGELRRFPRAGLATRLGRRLVERISQAFGEVDEPLGFHHPSPDHRHREELEYPSNDLEILNDRLDRLIDRACRGLTEARRGALRVECRLDSESQPPRSFRVGLFSPTADPGHLSRLLRTALESKTRVSPVSRMTLSVTRTGPLGQQQTALFSHGSASEGGGEAGDRIEISRLVDSLSGRLGTDRVLGVRLHETPLPEAAFRSFPLTGRELPSRAGRKRVQRQQAGRKQAGRKQAEKQQKQQAEKQREKQRAEKQQAGRERVAHDVPSPGDALRRPLILLRRPRPLSVVETPSVASPESCPFSPETCPGRFRLEGKLYRVVRCWGPERIETGWWRGRPVRRDYYRVLTDRGECWWAFRDLGGCDSVGRDSAGRDSAGRDSTGRDSTNDGEAAGRGWMLHGYFA